MTPVISIIIPVYNVEPYLDKCLESVVNQTLTNIEIILIDDGSTDKSRDIIKKFVHRDKRIKSIYQENRGVSEARNKGLKIACGEYIGFVDSDDYIELDMYENMYKEAKSNGADIVICNVNDINNEEVNVSLKIESELICIDEIGIDNFLKSKYFSFGHAVWHKIYKREIVEANNIRFIDYSKVSSEDTIFNIQCMLKSNRIYSIDKPLYNYYIRRNGSITSSIKSKTNMINRCKNTVEIIDLFCDKNDLEIGYYKYYLNYSEMINALSFVKPINISQIYKSIKEYSTTKLFKDTLKMIALTDYLEDYFISEKSAYSQIYKYFDRMFCLLCILKLYRAASILHYLRLQRSIKIQEKN